MEVPLSMVVRCSGICCMVIVPMCSASFNLIYCLVSSTSNLFSKYRYLQCVPREGFDMEILEKCGRKPICDGPSGEQLR